jgi:hypothetical protein
VVYPVRVPTSFTTQRIVDLTDSDIPMSTEHKTVEITEKNRIEILQPLVEVSIIDMKMKVMTKKLEMYFELIH